MRLRHVIAFLILCAAACVARAADVPTPQQIETWWKSHSSEEFTLEGPLHEIHLMDKEVAYIAPVGFYARGRNFIWHAILVRPRLQQVRELPSPIGNENISVLGLGEDEASSVQSESSTSGQGSTSRVRSIVRFDGDTPVVMHAAIEGDNLGNCEGVMATASGGCRKVAVEWKFGRSSDGVDTLVETVTTSTGRRSDRLTSTAAVRQYFLYEGTFVRDDWR